jgi:hypothetical protein
MDPVFQHEFKTSKNISLVFLLPGSSRNFSYSGYTWLDDNYTKIVWYAVQRTKPSCIVSRDWILYLQSFTTAQNVLRIVAVHKVTGAFKFLGPESCDYVFAVAIEGTSWKISN